jgi:hypothetical protein
MQASLIQVIKSKKAAAERFAKMDAKQREARESIKPLRVVLPKELDERERAAKKMRSDDKEAATRLETDVDCSHRALTARRFGVYGRKEQPRLK